MAPGVDAVRLNVITSEEEFGQRLLIEFDRAKRYFRSFSIALIDMESFAEDAGEGGQARRLALLGAAVRSSDLVGTVDGGQCCVLLVETTVETGRLAAEQILVRCIERAADATPIAEVCLSIGVAALEEAGDSLRSVMERAELAMQLAREAGGDRVAGMWSSGSTAISDLALPRPGPERLTA